MRVFLGLGANLGLPCETLRRALGRLMCTPSLRLVASSLFYESDALLPESASPEWNIPYQNLVAEIETELSLPALLQTTQAIEREFGRKPRERWAPRELDIDLIWAAGARMNEPDLIVPHKEALKRPFVMLPLCDLAPDIFMEDGKSVRAHTLQWLTAPLEDVPFHTRISSAQYTQLAGIVNVTPDSFSDGGLSSSYNAACAHLDRLAAEGAALIDIGAESTRPGAARCTPEEEWARAGKVIEYACAAAKARSFKVSIDTRHPETAQRALVAGAHIINDVSGGSDAMLEVMREHAAELILMHSLSIPADPHTVMTDSDPLEALQRWSEATIARVAAAGISVERLILDPGVGFGVRAEQSALLLREAASLRREGVRLMIGHSRKSFLSLVTNEPFASRDIETAALSIELARHGIEYLRVHDVALNARALRAAALVSRRVVF